MIIFLFAFAIIMGLIAFFGFKASKAARKAKIRQDIELYNEIMSNGQNSKN